MEKWSIFLIISQMSACLHFAKEGIAWVNKTINVKNTIRILNSWFGIILLDKETVELVSLIFDQESC
ncbi:MAG: hypothetical protein VX186_02570 [Nitrospinota bacterium]|nr:hypothetical protein [Nitrospinota bacterium]